jgi:hypothetical protein
MEAYEGRLDKSLSLMSLSVKGEGLSRLLAFDNLGGASMPRRRARSLVWLLVMAVTVSPSATCWTVAMRERGRRGEQVTSILGIEIAAFLLFARRRLARWETGVRIAHSRTPRPEFFPGAGIA